MVPIAVRRQGRQARVVMQPVVQVTPVAAVVDILAAALVVMAAVAAGHRGFWVPAFQRHPQHRITRAVLDM